MQSDMDGPSSTQRAPGKRPRWLLWAVAAVVVVAASGVMAWREMGGKLKSTEPYRMALAKVQTAPEVIAQLGEPIRDAEILPSGSVFGDKANVMFRIAGPKGRASVRAEARRIGGKWGLSHVDVLTADQNRISLNMASESGGEGDAPAWKPGTAAKPDAQAVPVPPTSPGPDIQLELPDLAAPEK